MSHHCHKDMPQSGRKARGRGGGARKHVLPEWDNALLEPSTGGRPRAAGNGEEVGACITPYPLGDELPNPVMNTRHGLVRIRKVRRDGVDGVPVLIYDGGVARVVTLEAQRENGLAIGRWKLTRVDDHGGGGMLASETRMLVNF